MYIINTGVPHRFIDEEEPRKLTVCNLIFDPERIFIKDIKLSSNNPYCYNIFIKLRTCLSYNNLNFTGGQ